MAEKGARAQFEEIAMRMYAEGKSLVAIEDALGVSRQSLSEWKARTKRGGEELDEWDKARKVKGSYVQRMRALLDRELLALEESKAGSLCGGSLDAITKLGTLVQRWEANEKAPAYDKPKVFLETLEWIARTLQETDPEGLKVLACNFDHLTIKFKSECLDGNA